MRHAVLSENYGNSRRSLLLRKVTYLGQSEMFCGIECRHMLSRGQLLLPSCIKRSFTDYFMHWQDNSVSFEVLASVSTQNTFF